MPLSHDFPTTICYVCRIIPKKQKQYLLPLRPDWWSPYPESWFVKDTQQISNTRWTETTFPGTWPNHDLQSLSKLKISKTICYLSLGNKRKWRGFWVHILDTVGAISLKQVSSFHFQGIIQSRPSSLIYLNICSKFFQDNAKNCPEVNFLNKTTDTCIKSPPEPAPSLQSFCFDLNHPTKYPSSLKAGPLD